MAKVKKPKLEEVVEEQKGQGIGSLVNQSISEVTNVNEPRNIVKERG